MPAITADPMDGAPALVSRPARDKGFASPALIWALLHAPLVFTLFAPNLARSMETAPGGMRALLWIGAFVEATFLAALPFVASLPLVRTRVYPWVASLACALATVILAGDALLHQATSFHFNRFFLQIALQPSAIRDVGVASSDVQQAVTLAGVFLVADALVGGWAIRRFAFGRMPWKWLLVVLALEVGDRLGHGVLAFFGGPAVHATGQALPLQIPVRMNTALGKLTGRTRADPADLFQAAGSASGGLAPSAIRLKRRPDIILVLLESLPASHFDPVTMPRLTRRSADALVFRRHYASASSTHYALFSFFYGLPATQTDAVIGSGRTSLLFPVLKNHGYQARLLAASSVDWMGLRRSIFADVQSDLETEFPGEGYRKDTEMLHSARRFVEAADPDEPVFLLLFFVGTHFRYTYPWDAGRFRPTWDAKGTLYAESVGEERLRNRARNAAWEIDRKLDRFLEWYERQRGQRPLLLVTGDHGEEFLEHGRFGHSSDVTNEQIHVPFILSDEGLEPGVRDVPTGHIDVLPTLLSRLGDDHAPELYASGVVMTEAPEDRYLLTTVGWVPRLAIIGREMKVRFMDQDLGFGGMIVTDPLDRPLPDGEARLEREYPTILKSLKQ